MAAKRNPDINMHMFGQMRALIEEIRLEMHERPKGNGEEIAGLTASLAKLQERIGQDVRSDKDVAQLLERLEGTMAKLEAPFVKIGAALEEIIATLKTPYTRTGVVDLPTGRVQMTITEARKRKTT